MRTDPVCCDHRGNDHAAVNGGGNVVGVAFQLKRKAEHLVGGGDAGHTAVPRGQFRQRWRRRWNPGLRREEFRFHSTRGAGGKSRPMAAAQWRMALTMRLVVVERDFGGGGAAIGDLKRTWRGQPKRADTG